MAQPPPDSEDSDSQSEISHTSSILTEVFNSAEYFIERDGRLFHSHSNSHYPLPVDTVEQERLTVLHKCLFRLMGAPYYGPVEEHLQHVEGQPPKTVIDIGTGNGVWPMDMGAMFPHVRFRAFDLVPIATRYPLANVQFEIHDLNSQTRWTTNSIDMVHARDISLSVRHFPSLLAEILRILRPGGLFLSGEWGLYPAFHPSFGVDPNTTAPGLVRFYREVYRALAVVENIYPVAHSAVPFYIRSSLAFSPVTTRDFYLPIGSWHEHHGMKEMGHAMRMSLVKYAEAMKRLFQDAGMNEVQIESILEDVKYDLWNVEGLIAVYHAVWARKL